MSLTSEPSYRLSRRCPEVACSATPGSGQLAPFVSRNASSSDSVGLWSTPGDDWHTIAAIRPYVAKMVRAIREETTTSVTPLVKGTNEIESCLAAHLYPDLTLPAALDL